VAVFIFDCSSAHEAFASDALLAHKMNRGPGGQQPQMHNTVIPATGQPQSMVYPADTEGFDNKNRSLAGQAKGMERVLLERGLLEELSANGKPVGVCSQCKLSQEARDKAAKAAKAREEEVDGVGIEGMADRYECPAEVEDLERARNCCMQRVLSLQPDFVNEKPLLQLVIEKAGHKCLFLPKFHCELNPIEMVWGQTKQSESRMNLITQFVNVFPGFRELTDGTFPRAKQLVPESLDHVSTSNIRKYFRHCYRYMDAYR
jgi:hypothetical protein